MLLRHIIDDRWKGDAIDLVAHFDREEQILRASGLDRNVPAAEWFVFKFEYDRQRLSIIIDFLRGYLDGRIDQLFENKSRTVISRPVLFQGLDDLCGSEFWVVNIRNKCLHAVLLTFEHPQLFRR